MTETPTRSLAEAMGMNDAEVARLRAQVDRLAPARCDACYRTVPHTEPEQRACSGDDT